jgi:hypothetical protein
MALKFRYKSKEEVPAEALALYTERDWAFVLDVEGAVDKSRVDEFRASNIALANQLAEQKRRFEGIESEQVKAIAAERDALNSKLTAIQVDQGMVTVATKKGLRPSAIPDITVAPPLRRNSSKISRLSSDVVASLSLRDLLPCCG